MRKVIVQLRWRTTAEDGRSTPPTGPSYSTVAAFDPPSPNWPNEAWSVVIEPIPTLASPQTVLRFLSDLAPHHVLQSGVKFELLEGKRVVAEGTIIAELGTH